MNERYSVASFTKNFSWNRSYKRLHGAIRSGFSGKLVRTTRAKWRKSSGINDQDLELVPMNFFLYSSPTIRDYFILVDGLVELAIKHSYDISFAKLALFAFHMANSGRWSRSLWPDGRVAGWANDFIRESAWKNGTWVESAFQDEALEKFIEEHVEGKSTHKVFTNYRYMLRSANVVVEGNLQPFDFKEKWFLDAVHLFWDRQVFDGNLSGDDGLRDFQSVFFAKEIHKLLACDVDQAKAFIAVAFREYTAGKLEQRIQQMRTLRSAAAA